MQKYKLENNKTQLEKNIKFAENKIKTNSKKIKKAPAQKSTPDPNRVIKRRARKIATITRCEHVEMKHYAKGMCNHCYHLYGRTSLANKCPHTDKMNYAKGMCQNCYFNSYNQKKRGTLPTNPDEI